MFTYIPSGDTAFIVKAGNDISEEINSLIRKYLLQIEAENIMGIVDFIPSYNELLICYEPAVIGYQKLLTILKSVEGKINISELPPSNLILVPVFYDGEFGPDLNEVAECNSLSVDEVIEIHTSQNYLVYMLGFTPGFCYLGGMDQRIATPRKQTPRMKIPAGAVGIADKQTGIYPIESPGGWQLIGRTPLKLFDPDMKPEFLFHAGDFIRFYAVDRDEYEAILNDVTNNTYQPLISKYK